VAKPAPNLGQFNPVMTTREQGYIDVGDGRVWYESAGDGDRTLLLLHGGPGGNAEDLAPLLALAEHGFRVVRYDQLGSWRSDKPDDRSLWQVPRFVAEVERVRQALDLGQMHLLGQSWGSFLALEYALHHGEHLRSLILASGAASTRECVAGMDSWRRELPVATQALMARHEAKRDYDHPDYLAAVDELYRRHLCRVWPWPEPLARAMEHMAVPVYTTMWGPNEFTCTGTLLEWDRTDRLSEISVPTLITVGEFDEVHPSCAETMHRGIPDSALVVFEGCGHVANLEDPERYQATLLSFLEQVDSDSRKAVTAS
jgi:proline iminopeptidase